MTGNGTTVNSVAQWVKFHGCVDLGDIMEAFNANSPAYILSAVATAAELGMVDVDEMGLFYPPGAAKRGQDD